MVGVRGRFDRFSRFVERSGTGSWNGPGQVEVVVRSVSDLWNGPGQGQAMVRVRQICGMVRDRFKQR
jgi:hypothetical protein